MIELLLHNLRTIGTHHCDGTVGEEAASEIERLRGENGVLRKLLHEAEAVILTIDPEDANEMEKLADLRVAIICALDQHRKPPGAQQFGTDLWSGATP